MFADVREAILQMALRNHLTVRAVTEEAPRT
jgi:hypothetical protein